MYREIQIHGEIPTDIINKIYEICSNIENVKVTLRITNEDLKKQDDGSIIVDGKNSFILIYPNEDQLIRGKYSE